MNIKTSSDLKYIYQQNNPNGHFFDRKTMKFFGDTMRNFGVRRTEDGNIELYRRKPVMHGLQKSHYFTPDGKEIPAKWGE